MKSWTYGSVLKIKQKTGREWSEKERLSIDVPLCTIWSVEKTTFVEVRGTENPGFVLDADALDSIIRKAVTISSDSLL